LVTPRVLLVSMLAVFVGLLASGVALLLTRLIGFVTNLAFYGRVSTAFTSPADNKLGLLVIVVPVLGGLIVGVMARWGSAAIRGHGIPEAMEQVLFNESRVAPRLTLLKPLSAAFAIGTGGPFGAEGPIIATGGALGSLLGQVVAVTAHERKALLAAGAAAGMAATFGTPVSAVILAVELLLFEYRAQSLIPVALASATAAACRAAAVGSAPVFAMPHLDMIASLSLPFYVGLGAVLGVFSVWVTRAVYAVEDLFERLPIHWMWWPALGGLAVGAVGYVAPHTLGVGYDNIDHILSGQIVGRALLVLCVAKFGSWVIALGSGTSGGTLAPIFTIGGALGGLLGAIAATSVPGLGIDPRMAAVVGMAALFAGASHATLASVVFAYETTHESATLLPLLGGCAASYLVSCLLMRTSIMTEKIARRGIRVRGEYAVDHLEQLCVRGHCTTDVVTLRSGQLLAEARAWMLSALAGAGHSLKLPRRRRRRSLGCGRHPCSARRDGPRRGPSGPRRRRCGAARRPRGRVAPGGGGHDGARRRGPAPRGPPIRRPLRFWRPDSERSAQRGPKPSGARTDRAADVSPDGTWTCGERRIGRDHPGRPEVSTVPRAERTSGGVTEKFFD